VECANGTYYLVKITDFLEFEPYATPLGLRILQEQRFLIENPQSKQKLWNTGIKKSVELMGIHQTIRFNVAKYPAHQSPFRRYLFPGRRSTTESSVAWVPTNAISVGTMYDRVD